MDFETDDCSHDVSIAIGVTERAIIILVTGEGILDGL
jgi:hypothetical protein